MSASFTIVPDSQTLTLASATHQEGQSLTVYSDSGTTTSVSLPATVTTQTTYYLKSSFAKPGRYADVVVKNAAGTALGQNGSFRVSLADGSAVAFTPSPTLDQTVAADSSTFASNDRKWAPSATKPAAWLNRTVITNFQAGHGWTATNNDASTNLNNTSNPPIGSQYATLVSEGVGTGTAARLTSGTMSVDLTNKTIWLLMRISNTAYLSSVQVFAGDSGFANYWIWQLDRYIDSNVKSWWREGEWAWMPFTFADATATGSPVLSAVANMRIAIVDTGAGGVGKITADIASVATSPSIKQFAWPQGVVSFTCDDGYSSQYSTMRPILDGYLYPACAYVIADCVDGTTSLGAEPSMTLTEVQSLQNVNGWQIGAHASTLANHNAGFGSMTAAQLDAEFTAMKQWLHDNDLYGGDHLAYPLGQYSDTVTERAHRYFTSARALQTLPVLEPVPPGDRIRLRPVALDNGTTLATAKSHVDEAVASGAWLIFVCHKLGATADSLTWVTSDFQSLVDYIATKNIPVRTVNDVLEARNEEAMRMNGAKVLASTFPTVSPGVVNTVTETPIASLTVPASKVKPGDVLIFDAAWDFLNNSGSSVTYTYRLKVGGATVGQTGAISVAASAQRGGARGRFLIDLPQLNSPRISGEFFGSFAGGGFSGVNTSHSGVLQPATPAVDFSSDTVVQLTCQMGTAVSTADFRPVAATISRQASA